MVPSTDLDYNLEEKEGQLGVPYCLFLGNFWSFVVGKSASLKLHHVCKDLQYDRENKHTATISGQFDYAISDVEELFQRRLVSDVLHSTFRNVLELHIEVKLNRIYNSFNCKLVIHQHLMRLHNSFMFLNDQSITSSCLLTPALNFKGRRRETSHRSKDEVFRH